MTTPANIWSFGQPPITTSKTIPRRKRGRPCSTNAARERSRVRTLRLAFLELQNTLPAVPPDTKLSKLDVLVLATTYISHLLQTLKNSYPEEMSQLDCGPSPPKRIRTEQSSKRDNKTNPVLKSDGLFRPVKKWPMRSRLYASIFSSTETTTNNNNINSNKFSKETTNTGAASSQKTRT